VARKTIGGEGTGGTVRQEAIGAARGPKDLASSQSKAGDRTPLLERKAMACFLFATMVHTSDPSLCGQPLCPGFGASERPWTILHDADGCTVTYDPAFLDAKEASWLFDRLLAEAPFEQEAPVMFGRPRPVRRRSCAFGDPGIGYHYSGLLRRAHPWPDALVPVHRRVQEGCGVRFNFVLCNLYPDGKAGLGWHADDEDDLLRDAPIASLSLGAVRDFALRRGRHGPASHTLALAHGSLLVMAGPTQRFYQHRVPPRARCHEPRINLTFRVLR
jgi:alkylated DNA repair dioxygenase AlkB